MSIICQSQPPLFNVSKNSIGINGAFNQSRTNIPTPVFLNKLKIRWRGLPNTNTRGPKFDRALTLWGYPIEKYDLTKPELMYKTKLLKCQQ